MDDRGADQKRSRPPTFAELLRQRAAEDPDRLAYVFLEDGEREGEAVTYGELERRVGRVGALLRRHAGPGERALLLYPPGIAYIEGLLGCIHAGVIAVPAYPPDPARPERTLPRIRAIAADARPALALTTAAALPFAEAAAAAAPELGPVTWLATDAAPGLAADAPEPLRAEGPALLQYTSGSTGTPRGVILGHDHLWENSALIGHGFGLGAGSVGVIWLPPYHDMGLIGGILQPLFQGMTVVLMPPMAFLRRPLRWLEAVSRYRATVSGGPNFAYDLCVRRSTPEERARLDLSAWEVAFTGAEPVRADTLERFAEAFAPAGLRREALYPCYGLAEATLIVSGGARSAPPVVRPFLKADLERGEARRADPHAPEGVRGRSGACPRGAPERGEGVRLVGCGRALPGVRLRIVRPEDRTPCAPGTVGEVWVQGPSVARGYWERPEETEHAFQARLADGEGPYLRTGDLGFTLDEGGGELFLVGRLKDLIVLRGRNHYPHDLEATVERCHPALRPGCGAAFSVEAEGEERLVVVHEIDAREAPHDEVLGRIREALAEQHEIAPWAIALATPRTVPKTSSGKIQRRACREAFLAGTLAVVAGWQAQPAEGGDDAGAGRLHALVARLAGLPEGALDPSRSLAWHGLDSIRTVELCHRIEAELGVALPPAALLACPSLAALAARIEAATRIDAAPGDVRAEARPAASGEAEAELPLCGSQRAIWFFQQLAPASRAYHLVRALRVREPLDAGALRAALQGLVERHAALRATFAARQGEPVQRIAARAEVAFTAEDAASLDEAQLRARIAEESARPFDLRRGPLFRALALSRAPAEHVLVLGVHHLVCDLWSLEVAIPELSALYAAARRGAAAELPPLSWSPGDHARREAALLAGPEGERLWSYWRRALEGAPPALDLPTDRPRPGVPSFRGGRLDAALGPELTRRVQALAREREATLFMALFAAFAAVLSRYSGQRDLVIGVPAAGRAGAELSGVIGCFVNPLPLRADLSGDPTFLELLSQVRRRLLDALEHEAMPLQALVERLKPARDPSRAPLFQVMLALESPHRGRDPHLCALALGVEGAEVDLGGLRAEILPLTHGASRLDLSLVAGEVGGELALSFEYSADLFDEATVARLARSLRSLLRAAVEAPEARVSALPLLDVEERRRLLVAWNDTRAAYPGTGGVHRLFLAQAARRPDAPAVIADDGRLSYGELERRSGKLALRLRRLGVGPGRIVGLHLGRSMDAVVAILAVLRAGGAYVPLDPSYPAERLRWMAEDAGVALVLSHGAIPPELAGGARALELSGAWDEILAEPGQPPDAETGPDDLAYVIYTSGSTGRPKGVAVPHRGVCNTAASMARRLGVEPGWRMLQLAPLAFDASVSELWIALAAGAALVIAPEGTLPGEALRALLRAREVTAMAAVPSALSVLPAEDLPALRVVLSAGEACAADLVRRWAAPGRRFWNAYGPTEAAVCVTMIECSGMVTGPPPIGRPLDNVRAYVLDARREPVPVGVPGELWVGGAGLAAGYLRRPALTAERFAPDPFCDEPGARMYRTGDLARFRADGVLEFVGRVDHQVKIRGCRVEPGEIEALLGEHPAVGQAAVVARPGAGGGAELVAYVAPRGGIPCPVEELRAALRAKLPAYMVPSALVPVDALPRTPSGKLDRAALPAPRREPAGDEPAAPPRDQIEEALARSFCQALGRDRVSVHAHFFDDLGGSSLTAVKAADLASSALEVEIPVVRLFEHPTIAALARSLRGDAAPPSLRSAEARTESRRAAILARQRGRGTGGREGSGP